MPTLLATAKMNPALRARVESSVAGRRLKVALERAKPSVVALLRFATLIALVSLVVLVVIARRRAHEERETARATLLDAVERASAGIGPDELSKLDRIHRFLSELSGAYKGDSLAGDLSRPGKLGELVARPSVYVRGPLDAFSLADTTAKAAAQSSKDALLFCLIDPPASQSEKDVFSKARRATGPLGESAMAHVGRLHDAEIGFPLLRPDWAASVRDAADTAVVGRLQRAFDRVPLERTRQVAKAELLIAAMDEPNEPGGVTELDGEHAHFIRLGIVDLMTNEVLVRQRKRVDPSWISLGKRAEYAAILDSCLFGLEVRQAIE